MKTKVTFLTAIAIVLSTVFCLIQAPPASADTTVVLETGLCTTTCEKTLIDTSNCTRIRLTVGTPQSAQTTNKKATVSYRLFDMNATLPAAISVATCNYNSTTCTQDVDTPGVLTGFNIVVTDLSPSVLGAVPYTLYCRESGGGT